MHFTYLENIDACIFWMESAIAAIWCMLILLYVDYVHEEH